MANIQISQGYTRIANSLLEAICKYVTNPTWIRILLYIIRLTYGFQRKEVDSNYQSFSTKLSLTKDYIKSSLWEMKDVGILEINIVSKERFNVKIVKDFDKWKIRH